MVKPTPRPHYELRIAHAEGYEIEYYNERRQEWVFCSDPAWNPGAKYRVVPMLVEKKTRAYLDDTGHLSFTWDTPLCNNVKFVFDSRTNELISVEKI